MLAMLDTLIAATVPTPILITAASGAGAAGASALVGWLIARRQHSGQVATTDADRIWDFTQSLLEMLRDDNTALRDRHALRDQAEETMRERLRAVEMRQHISELAESDCNARADALAVANKVLDDKVRRLERALNIDANGDALSAAAGA